MHRVYIFSFYSNILGAGLILEVATMVYANKWFVIWWVLVIFPQSKFGFLGTLKMFWADHHVLSFTICSTIFDWPDKFISNYYKP